VRRAVTIIRTPRQKRLMPSPGSKKHEVAFV
jgi:hypothetical protein